jgi:esterase/lipase superfamily enzyme
MSTSSTNDLYLRIANASFKMLGGAVALLLVVAAASAAEQPSHQAALSRDAFWIVNTRHAPQETPCYDPGRMLYQQWVGGHVENSTLGEFLEALSPDVPVCFFIHGNLTDSLDARRDAQLACHVLRHAARDGEPMTFVLVSWPSERLLPLTTWDLGVKAERSDATGYYLAHLLMHLPAEQPVCLIGHSLGARTAVGSLHLLNGGAVRGQRLAGGSAGGPQHVHAALLAASVDHDWLNRGDRFGRALASVEAMVIFTNRRDAALGLYPLRKPFSPAALGKVGSRNDDWRCIAWDDGEKVSQVEVSELIGGRHHVSAYFQESAVSDLLAPLVYFRDAPTRNPLAGR